jgi:hypothetical protein
VPAGAAGQHVVAFALGVLAAASRWSILPARGRELSAAAPLR